MKVLMVCLGNICRSPLAHGILRNKSHNLGWEVDSAGTAAYHEGEGPDPRSVYIAKKNGLRISDLKARKITVDDFDKFDIIYVMDKSNYNDVLKLARTEADKAKGIYILNEVEPNTNQEVPDPYYGGDNGFIDMYKLLDNATNHIINKYS